VATAIFARQYRIKIANKAIVFICREPVNFRFGISREVERHKRSTIFLNLHPATWITFISHKKTLAIENGHWLDSITSATPPHNCTDAKPPSGNVVV
jgi:hypothetical protein